MTSRQRSALASADVWNLDRSLSPLIGQHLSLAFFDLGLNGTVRSRCGDLIELHVDSRATCLVLKAGWHMTCTYPLAQGVIDAKFVVVGARDNVVRLRLLGVPHVQQRRRHPRITTFVRALVIRQKPHWAHPAHVSGTTVNLSLGGARLRFHDVAGGAPDEREEVAVELALPTARIRAVATVLQTLGDGARVRFVELDTGDASLLADVIDAGLR